MRKNWIGVDYPNNIAKKYIKTPNNIVEICAISPYWKYFGSL